MELRSEEWKIMEHAEMILKQSYNNLDGSESFSQFFQKVDLYLNDHNKTQVVETAFDILIVKVKNIKEVYSLPANALHTGGNNYFTSLRVFSDKLGLHELSTAISRVVLKN